MLQLFSRPQYVWFSEHLYGPAIPNSSGQLAELIVYIIPPEYICIVIKSYYIDLFSVSTSHFLNTHSYCGNEFPKDKHKALGQLFVYQIGASNCWNISDNKQHLNHWGRVTYICISKTYQHVLR